MKKFRKKYWLSILVTLLLVISFLFGPLFPWSPVKPGYESKEAEHYIVYSQKGTVVPEFYSGLDTEIGLMSASLDLPIKRDITIIRTEKGAFKGYLPWMQTERLGGASLQSGNVLYVSYEKIAEQQLDEHEFVKHELTHILMHQNTTLGNAFRANSITYLSEGIPFSISGPHYFPRNVLIEKVKKLDLKETKKGDAIYTDDTFSSLDEVTGERYKVSHMVYGEFIRYLIATYGKEKTNAFIHAFLKDPGSHRTLFAEHFGVKLETSLQQFEDTL